MLNHPLFPPENDDEEAPEVEGIHVSRYGEGPPKWCAYLFGAEELTELQQIQEMFGGGTYELIARAGGRISARRRYVLDGRSRPLVYGAAVTEPTPQPTPPAQPVPVVTGDAGGLGLIAQMMMQSQQSTMQLVTAMMTTVTSMATAMVSRDSESSKATLSAMAQVQNQAMAQQGAFFNAMMQNKTASGGPSFRDGIELGKEIAGKGADGETDDDEVLSMIKTGLEVVQGMSGATSAPDVDAAGAAVEGA